MKLAQDIILEPIISEKSMSNPDQRKYTFKVQKTSNKVEIAKAVESLFDVKVTKVNTMHVRGRKRRMGRNEGYTPSFKKAIVTLTQDSKNIEFFESLA